MDVCFPCYFSLPCGQTDVISAPFSKNYMGFCLVFVESVVTSAWFGTGLKKPVYPAVIVCIHLCCLRLMSCTQSCTVLILLRLVSSQCHHFVMHSTPFLFLIFFFLSGIDKLEWSTIPVCVYLMRLIRLP